VKPAQRRDLVQFVRVGFQVRERRACHIIPVHRSTQPYRSIAQDQTALRMRIRDLAAVRVRYGYRRLHILLQRAGWRVNHKRVYRLYRLEGLSLRFKSRKKRPSSLRVAMPMAQAPHEPWSLDCISDRLCDGRRFHALT
jgi:putative transposase